MIKLIYPLFALLLFGCTSYGPVFATGNRIPKEKKVGESCRSWLIHRSLPFSWGRNDIMEAATRGGIEEIAVVDKATVSYILYGTECTLVYGK